MDKLKLAVENYIFAKKMLRRAAAKLEELDVRTAELTNKIDMHICITPYKNWNKLKEVLEIEKTETRIRGSDRFPASEHFEYKGVDVFRLLGGAD